MWVLKRFADALAIGVLLRNIRKNLTYQNNLKLSHHLLSRLLLII